RTLPEAPAFSERPPLSAGPMGTMPMSVGGQPWQRTQRLDELVDETAVPPTRTAMHAAVAPMGTPPPAEHTVAPAPRGGAGAWIAVAVGVAGLLGAVAVVGWQVMAHGNSATAQQDAAEEASPAVSAIPAVAAPSAAVEALIPSASAAPSAPPAGSAAVRPATLAGSKPVKSQPEPASTAQPTAQAPSATAAPVPVAPRPPKAAAPKPGL